MIEALKHDATVQDCLELPALKAMSTVWDQQYERANGKLVWLESKDMPSERVQSPFDVEACYGKRKQSWVGFKVHLTEACDADAPNLITNVLVTKASAQDMLAAKQVHERLKHNKIEPGQHFVDAGYVSAGLVLEIQKAGIEVIGPMPHSSTWQERAGKGFALDNFKIDWENEVVTCSRGKPSQHWVESSSPQGLSVIHAEFSRQDCHVCRSKRHCTKAKTLGRELTFRPRAAHEVLRAGRAAQETDEWKALYANRAGVEGAISQTVRSQGLRVMRYRGMAQARVQSVATAAGSNVGRVFNWFEGLPRAKTRVPRFARLVLQA